MISFIINSKHGSFKVLVDDDDYERINKHSWSISFSNKNYYRVESRINKKLVRLHRFILKLNNPNIHVDHKDGNTLNNQKNNLRLCNHKENMRNIKKKKNKTGYTGVYRNNIKGKYRACMSINDKTYHIQGNYKTAKEAAKARDKFALKIRGEFANLNFKKERGS